MPKKKRLEFPTVVGKFIVEHDGYCYQIELPPEADVLAYLKDQCSKVYDADPETGLPSDTPSEIPLGPPLVQAMSHLETIGNFLVELVEFRITNDPDRMSQPLNNIVAVTLERLIEALVDED